MFTVGASEPVGEGASTAEVVVVDSFDIASELSDMTVDVSSNITKADVCQSLCNFSSTSRVDMRVFLAEASSPSRATRDFA